MSERRDPVESGTADPNEPGPATNPGPFRKWLALTGPPMEEPESVGPPNSRRRVAILGSLLILAIATLTALGVLGRAATDWLGRRATYQLRFDQIVLTPEPPAYIKLNRTALLRQVRERAQAPEELSTLNLEPATLARWFGLHAPWIKEVSRIERSYPNHLVVHVHYREPVALVHQSRGPGIFLDRDAIVLPNLEIVPEAARPLLRIEGLPADRLRTKVGVGVAPVGDEDLERLAVAACRLAEFLKRRLIDERALPPANRPDLVNAREGANQLWVRTESHFWILWGGPPAEGSAGQARALARWEALLGWFNQPESGKRGPYDYLEFHREGPRLQPGRPPKGAGS